MADNTGWIKLHRKLLDNPLWNDCNANQKVVIITLLLRANHEPNKWLYKGEEYEIKQGEFVTSLGSLCTLTGLKTNIVRNTLEKLEKYQFITKRTTSANTIIKIENWDLYQQKSEDNNKENNKESNKDITKEITQDTTKTPQRPNKDTTTNKNDKNDKNDKKIKNKDKETFKSLISDYSKNEQLVKTLNDFVEYRKAKSKGFTVKALKLNLNKLSKVADTDNLKIAVVNQAIEKSWASFYPLKTDGQPKGTIISSNEDLGGLGDWN